MLKKAARVQSQDFVKVSQQLEDKSMHPAVIKSLRDHAIETYMQKKV